MKLPQGGRADRPVNERDFRTVEVGMRGNYVLDGKPMNLAQIEAVLVNEAKANPDLVLRIRADRGTTYDPVFQIQDMCANHGIRISLRAEPRENQR